MKKQLSFATALVALGAASWGVAAIAHDADAGAASATSVRLLQVAQTDDGQKAGRCAGKRGMQAIFDQLGLSADQQARIAAIRESGKAAKTALRNDTSLTREQKRERMRAMYQEHKRQVEAVLTPEQRTKLQSLLQSRRQNKQRGPGGGTTVKPTGDRI